MRAGEAVGQSVRLSGPARGGKEATLQIARDLRPVERGQFHAAVFGKDQQVGALPRGLLDPGAGLSGVRIPVIQEIQRIGGGGDPHGSVLIQNCRGLSLASVAPMSRQPKCATTPSSGA